MSNNLVLLRVNEQLKHVLVHGIQWHYNL